MDAPKTIILTCDIHPHNNIVQPVKGCASCWSVYYIYLLGTTPPEKQEEFLGNLEKLVKIAVKAENQGNWDLMLNQHPKVTIEKDKED